MSFLFVSSDAFPGPKWLITRGLWIWLPLVTKSVWKQPCCTQSNIPNERDSLCREAWILGCFINHTEIFSKVLYRIGRASVTWDIMKVLAINVFIFTFTLGRERLWIWCNQAKPAWLWDFLRHEIEKDWERSIVDRAWWEWKRLFETVVGLFVLSPAQ